MLDWIPLFSKPDRDARRLSRIINNICEHEARFEHLDSKQDFAAQTEVWRAELDSLGKEPGRRESHLQLLAADAFALVRAAARWLSGNDPDWHLVPYDVQLAGGRMLFDGKIAEMATGEGKTLTAVAPAYLRALTGRGVHLVTVSDYLARRDANWMGKLFGVLGLTVGCLAHDLPFEERKAAYQSDVTYGTASEFGFDYLRDHGMARSAGQQVQRDRYYAMIDEVDSVLIDEARTPLIISAASDELPRFLADYAPKVAALSKAQSRLCHDLVRRAKQLASRPERDAEDDREIGLLLYQCSLAHPLHPGLTKLKQDPGLLRLLENTNLFFHQDHERNRLIELKEELYFWIDERSHHAELTDRGCRFLAPECPELLQVGDLASALAEIDGSGLDGAVRERKRSLLERDAEFHAQRIHEIRQLVKANALYQRDRHYLLQNGEIIILDEAKGRPMPGRRWSDGLHQAIEAKEGVIIQPETETCATITLQNYFRQYEVLAGMTGTASADAAEFSDIYQLDVVKIPTHRPCQRIDANDKVYRTRNEKLHALAGEIAAAHERGQPVLVGTASVEASETVSRMLDRLGIRHEVLNARHPEREAEIVARAGFRGAVTISTNMAGRGTDIVLGEGVDQLGGLYVIGTERHESQRVDRQLRGRCARQGDPGRSAFFLSLEDDLMRKLDNAGRLAAILERVEHEKGEALEHGLLTRAIASAQQRVEKAHYEARRRTLKYDDVVNRQRMFLYDWRDALLRAPNGQDWLFEALPDCMHAAHRLEHNPDPSLWIEPTVRELLPGKERETLEELAIEGNPAKIVARLIDSLTAHVRTGCENIDSDMISPTEIIRQSALEAIDHHWKNHLHELDALRDRIHFHRFAQKDPQVEFAREASYIFKDCLEAIHLALLRVAVRLPDVASRAQERILEARRQPAATELKLNLAPSRTYEKRRVSRNSPCPCGSGRKFKKCCA